MLNKINKIFILFCLFLWTPLYADVNVLIIGSEKDSGEHRGIRGNSQAFSPLLLKEELHKILAGAKLGKVNVSLEERFSVQGGSSAYNLISWFHWPYPENVETETRWPNLRGEKGIKWDYVVLIGDPYTIENMPGLYSHGVAKIAAEVSKGSAETVLLMPWPGASSRSSTAHYKEVVYRTGRSGGFKVVPAALAWEAAGKPSGNTHPGKDGAYIAAAAIYSRIWNKSAQESSYSYNSKLADTVHKTVTANAGRQQYTGQFTFQSPFTPFSNYNRLLAPVKSGGGSSTEVDFAGRTADAIKRAGALTGSGARYTIGRYTGANPKGAKDFRNRGGRAFGYVYHSEGNSADKAVANITGWEMFLANLMLKESADYRLIPRRVLLGGLLQFDPDMKIVGGGHVYGPQATAVATYIYTLISGRCPVDPQPAEISAQWHAQKTGYEMAWHVANCQTRAPGFKVMPSNNSRHTLDPEKAEDMTVQFIFKPKKPVTVMIECDKPSVSSLSRQSLIFTPENYSTPQTVSISAVPGAKAATEVNISFKTVSEDEVYNGLLDNWQYHINSPPLANEQKVQVFSGQTAAVTLTGSDKDEEILSYSLDKEPARGSLTVNPEGVAAYTPEEGFTGTDTFSFKTHDGSVFSKAATVIISVKKPGMYNFNLLRNAGGELSPFSKFSWVETKGKWQQKDNAAEGIFTFGVLEGKEAELTQEVGVSSYAKDIKSGRQSFKISGLIDKSNDTVNAVIEFVDAAQKVLLSCDSDKFMTNAKSKTSLKAFECTQAAPPLTAVIRLRLISKNTGRGQSNGGRFDDLKIEALEPKK